MKPYIVSEVVDLTLASKNEGKPGRLAAGLHQRDEKVEMNRLVYAMTGNAGEIFKSFHYADDDKFTWPFSKEGFETLLVGQPQFLGGPARRLRMHRCRLAIVNAHTVLPRIFYPLLKKCEALNCICYEDFLQLIIMIVCNLYYPLKVKGLKEDNEAN